MPRLFACAITLTFSLLVLLTAGSCLAGVIVPVPVELDDEEVGISPNYRLEGLFAGTQTWPIIENVQLHLVGHHTCQYAYCAENPSYAVAPTDGAIAFGFMVGETETFRTEQGFTCVAEGEEFDLTLSFAVGQTPDWSFLAEGTGTLFIEHEPTEAGCAMFPIFVGVDAYLTTVELLVEMPESVPAETEIWGSIKAHYR